jgi:hypothetical protein
MRHGGGVLKGWSAKRRWNQAIVELRGCEKAVKTADVQTVQSIRR